MNNSKLEYLQCTFPKLTETNQYYVLGLAEGIKQAQRTVIIKNSNDGDVKNEQQKNHIAAYQTKECL